MVIRESEPATTESVLRALEEKYAFTFPEQYRRFLLMHNGGRPQPSRFQFLDARGPYTDSLIDWFLAVYDGTYDNFEWTFRTLKVEKVRMPLELIPIASDPFGNMICISTTGGDTGAVYFWDHERELDQECGLPPTWENVFLLSRTFDEFIANLK